MSYIARSYGRTATLFYDQIVSMPAPTVDTGQGYDDTELVGSSVYGRPFIQVSILGCKGLKG